MPSALTESPDVYFGGVLIFPQFWVTFAIFYAVFLWRMSYSETHTGSGEATVHSNFSVILDNYLASLD